MTMTPTLCWSLLISDTPTTPAVLEMWVGDGGVGGGRSTQTDGMGRAGTLQGVDDKRVEGVGVAVGAWVLEGLARYAPAKEAVPAQLSEN